MDVIGVLRACRVSYVSVACVLRRCFVSVALMFRTCRVIIFSTFALIINFPTFMNIFRAIRAAEDVLFPT